MRLPRIILVLLSCLSLGFHWGILQMAGWSGMVMKFSRTSTLSEALEKTFSGEHPCQICVLVQEKDASRSDGMPDKSGKLPLTKPLLATLWTSVAISSPVVCSVTPPGFRITKLMAKSPDKPAVPPPRRFSAIPASIARKGIPDEIRLWTAGRTDVAMGGQVQQFIFFLNA